MKSILFLIPVILVLACGANSVEEENTAQVEETQEVADTEVTDNHAAEISAEQEEPNNYNILVGAAGGFEIGITGDKVREVVNIYGNIEVEEIDLNIEGYPTPALELTLDSGESMLLYLNEDDNTVYRIKTNSDLFTTAQGIGCSSTYADLENSYTFEEVSWGDSGDPVVIIEEQQMSFVLEPGDWWQMGDFQGDVPADTGINSIILW